MSAQLDITRVVRSWLGEDEHDTAGHVLEVVLSRLDTTPQRRPMWPPRRFIDVSNMFRLAVAGAAVMVMVLVGLQFIPSTPGPGGPSVEPSLPPSPSPATPSPSQGVRALPDGSLAPGAYRVTGNTSRALTLTVPAGWTHVDGNFVTKGDPWGANGVALATWPVSHIYADSCRWEGTLVPVTSAASIVAALAAQAGHATSETTAVTIGGQPATRLEFSLGAAFDVAACDRGIVRLWPDAGPREEYGLPIYPGQSTVVLVVDHGSSATLLVSIRNDDSPAADVAELQAVLDSIVFVE
jgi:hypothetical protein